MLLHGPCTERTDGGTPPVNTEQSAPGGVLIPVFAADVSDQALGIAISIAAQEGNTLRIVGMETVPEQTPLDHPRLPIDGTHRVQHTLQRARGLGPAGLEVTGAARVGRQYSDMIAHELTAQGIHVLLIESTAGEDIEASQPEAPIESIFESVECDVVMATGAEHLGDIASVLVPIAGGPHSGLAVDVAKAIAEEHGSWLELFHVIEPDAGEDERTLGTHYVEAAVDRLGDFERADTWILEAPDIAEAIIEQTQYYSLTILGAPQKSRLKRFIFGSKTDVIRELADSTVLTVRSTDSEPYWFEAWLGRTA